MRILLILVLSLLGCSGSIDEPVSYFNVEMPRPFGYVIGDEIPQRIVLETRSGISLQTGSLPGKGQISRWLNLNQVTVKQSGRRYEIDLRYQIFYASLEVKSLTLPGFTVQLSQGEKTISQSVPAWSFTLSPLRELVVRQTEQGEYMRPDSPPSLLANTQALYGLAISLAVAVLIAAYISYLYGCFPNRLRRTLFKQALRKLAGLSKTDMEQALTIVHHILNSLNGQPLFYNRLSDFYRCNPQYLQVSSQLTWFFNFSNRYFFSAGMIVVAQYLQQLKDLCERCRKIERGQPVNLAVDTPWALTGLLLALLPLFNSGMRSSSAPWLTLIPSDTLSVFVVCCLRLCAMAAIAGLILGMAGLHRTEQSRERIGHGAHIVLLLDRSSMDNSFAGRAPNGSEESKSTAARRLLTDFVKQRQTDLIGVAEYSTSPLFVMPLTENKNAVQAAIAATATPALGFTHVSKGLGMAISFFQQQPVTGSRIVLLVSDGAAAIDHDSEQKLRE